MSKNSLYRCPGCRRYSTYDRYGELSGVTYNRVEFYSTEEHFDYCEDCGQPAEDFEKIAKEPTERLQRKLGMTLGEMAGYLNSLKL